MSLSLVFYFPPVTNLLLPVSTDAKMADVYLGNVGLLADVSDRRVSVMSLSALGISAFTLKKPQFY